jgi:RNA polymerase sigma-70 factor (ECF subfamily)
MIAHAQGRDPAASRRCLGLLIQRYWRPVFHYLKCHGRGHEDAKDLTQGFFARFLEKDAIRYADKERGRFRNFLLGSVKRFMAQERRSMAAGPGERSVADFDTELQAQVFGKTNDENPEAAFTRNWLKSLVENALCLLRKECVACDRTRQFLAFRSRFLSEGSVPSYRQIAESLGTTEKDVENLLFRARKRFRRIFLNEIRNSTFTDLEAQDEVRDLLAMLDR